MPFREPHLCELSILDWNFLEPLASTMERTGKHMRHRHTYVISLLGAALWLIFPSCKESPTEVGAFNPEVLNDGWPVSTPEAQGLDRQTLASGYDAAAKLPYSYSLLVVRNGYLISEQYFNGDSREVANNVKSVSKSVLSGLVGIALAQRYLDSLNQRMLSFFPEYVTPSLDPRKYDISIRHLLMMRAGFGRDEDVYFQVYNSSNWIRTTIELPLLSSPGERMVYNTFETHLVSAILTKASGMSTYEFAGRYLCEPLGITLHFWEQDPQGYYFGGNSMGFTPRDLAKFGSLYLAGGYINGRQIIPKQWIDESLSNFTNFQNQIWGDLNNYNYGYLWWMGELDGYRVYFALGHGGQFVLNVPDLDMIVVSTANPEFDWNVADEHERAILHIIGFYVLGAVSR
jgi:CubicO group peptidase (beta-lactamase class C family)